MLSFPSPSWSQSQTRTIRTSTYAGRAATEILPRLYLSDYFTATSKRTLKRLGITHVVSLMESEPLLSGGGADEEEEEEYAIEDSRRMHISIADRGDEDILKWLDKTTEFIQAALDADKNHKVLVHCLQGISRSATVVCAYVIATTGKTGPQSIDYVRSKRGIVCPNVGFQAQLDRYATRFVGSKRPGGRQNGKKQISEGIAARIKWLKGTKSSASSVKSQTSSSSSIGST